MDPVLGEKHLPEGKHLQEGSGALYCAAIMCDIVETSSGRAFPGRTEMPGIVRNGNHFMGAGGVSAGVYRIRTFDGVFPGNQSFGGRT